MLKRILTSMALVLFIISTAYVANASESEVLLKMLLKKGIITHSEYNE